VWVLPPNFRPPLSNQLIGQTHTRRNQMPEHAATTLHHVGHCLKPDAAVGVQSQDQALTIPKMEPLPEGGRKDQPSP